MDTNEVQGDKVPFRNIAKGDRFKAVLGDGKSLSICTLVKIACGSAQKPNGDIQPISENQLVVLAT